jgi:outer membrane immunogenic protein
LLQLGHSIREPDWVIKAPDVSTIETILMKKFLTIVAGTIALAISGPANAADLAARPYTKAPAAVAAYDWSGFYVGATAGGSWGSFDPTTSTDGGSYFVGVGSTAAANAAGAQSIKPSGFTGGLEAGYNFQFGSALLGIEADVEYMRLRGAASSSAVYPCCGSATLTISSSASTDWLATIRGRLGFVANDWLFFGTGGVAFTQLKGSFSASDNCGAVPICGGGFPNGAEPSVSLSNTRVGYVVGAGVEKAVAAHWTVKAEYLYTKFDSVSASGVFTNGTFSAVMNHSIDLKANIVRVGANYRF